MAENTDTIFSKKLVDLTGLGTFWNKIKEYLASNYDTAGSAAQVKTDVIGADTNTASDNTIYGAKKYADSLASNYDTAGSAAQVKTDVIGADTNTASDNTIYGAKKYADSLASNYDTAGSAADAAAAVRGSNNDAAEAVTVYGAKAYTDKKSQELSAQINQIIAGGVTFAGVVGNAADLAGKDVNGGVITVKADAIEFKVGAYTFKPGYEYIYYKPTGVDNGVWYELGDSDKNAKAIVVVDGKADANKALIDAMDKAYKQADADLLTAIGNIAIATTSEIENIVK